MPEKSKERAYRVFLEAPDGSANRTVEVVAADKKEAERIARRAAEDVAEQYGGEVYEIKTVDPV